MSAPLELLIAVATAPPVPTVEPSGPSPWLSFTVLAIGAVATSAAAIVAVCLARRDGRELKRLREREATAQARAVVVRGVKSNSSAKGPSIEVLNASAGPIHDVWGFIATEARPDCEKLAIQDVIAPGEKATGASPGEDASLLRFAEVQFVDTNGVRWRTIQGEPPRRLEAGEAGRCQHDTAPVATNTTDEPPPAPSS